MPKEKSLVAFTKSGYVNFFNSLTDGCAACLAFFLFLQIMTPKHDNTTKERAVIANTFRILEEYIFCLDITSLQSGNSSNGVLAYNFLFPCMNTSLSFWNIPPGGTGPSRLLNDKLRFFMELKDWKKFGISPDKLFWDRSITMMPLKFKKFWGILPWKLFPSMCNDSKWTHSPRVEGISPDNWLLEIFNAPRFTRLPISSGISPESLLWDKSKPSARLERVKSSFGKLLSKLLQERFSMSNFL